jgi:hypothetical protein
MSSASYGLHVAKNAQIATDAVAPCPILPDGADAVEDAVPLLGATIDASPPKKGRCFVWA